MTSGVWVVRNKGRQDKVEVYARKITYIKWAKIPHLPRCPAVERTRPNQKEAKVTSLPPAADSGPPLPALLLPLSAIGLRGSRAQNIERRQGRMDCTLTSWHPVPRL